MTRSLARLVLAFIAAASAAAALAVPSLERVRDINHTVKLPQPGGGPVPFNGGWLASFCRDEVVTSSNRVVCDMWFTDGSSTGARLLKSVDDDPSYALGGVTVMGGYGYFLQVATGPYSETLNLWRTDGTAADTMILATLPVAVSGLPAVSNSVLMAATDSLLFFRGASDTLWRSDGTAAGTFQVSNVPVTSLVTGGGRAWFTGSSGAGEELYVSDGTAAGTTLVKDINAGTASSFPRSLAFAAGRLFFYATETGASSPTVWSTDGTDAGTIKLLTTTTAATSAFVSLAGRVFFLTQEPVSGAQGKLWSSDGTPDGTTLVSSSFGTLAGSQSPLLAAGPRVYFATGSTVWSSDGTGPGTAQVALPTTTLSVEGLTQAGTDLYFSVIDSTLPASTWKITNGGTTATRTAVDSTLGPAGALGSTLLLANSVTGLFTLDAGGSFAPLAVGQAEHSSSAVCRANQPSCCKSNTVVVGAYAYFAADDGIHGCELWRSDGSERGTQLVVDTVPGLGNGFSQPVNLMAAPPYVYMFVANGPSADVWRTDGTSVGSFRIAAFTDQVMGGTALGSSLLVATFKEVWRFDPGAAARVVFTRPSTSMTLQSIQAGAHFLAADLYTSTGDRIMANDGNGGPVVDLVGNYGDALTGAASLPACVLFGKFDVNPAVMWRTDGTVQGTFALGQMIGGPAQLSANGRLYYMSPTSLMESDCTLAGTRAVAALPAGVLNLELHVGGSTVWLVAPGYSNHPIYAWRPGASALQLVATPSGASSFVASSDTAFYVQADGTVGRASLASGASTVFDADPGPNASQVTMEAMLPASNPTRAFGFANRNGMGWEPHRVVFGAGANAAHLLDFNGDGRNDILWKNATGASGVMTMVGTMMMANTFVSGGSGYDVAFVGDFDGDGNTDLLYRGADGSYKIQLMGPAGVKSEAVILGAGTGWQVMAKGDFNGDGKTDLLWKSASGTYGMWLMNGTAPMGAGLFDAPGIGWDVQLIADFGGDGKSDILWRNSDGRIQEWAMDGANTTGQVTMTSYQNLWTPLYAADFDGDGKADIVWSYPDGSIAVWLVDGTTVRSATVLAAGYTGWSVKGVGDLDGDGKADIVLQHTNGTVGAWLMNGSGINSAGTFGPPGYSLATLGDFDADGKIDILWKGPAGDYVMTLMNGLSMYDPVSLVPPGSGWTPITPAP